MRKPHQNQRGQIVPLLGFTFLLIIGFLGLAVDVNNNEAQQLLAQGDADMSSLTAAKLWGQEITAHGYTGPPAYSDASPDAAVLEAGQVAYINGALATNLSPSCVVSSGGSQLQVIYYNGAFSACPDSSVTSYVKVAIPPITSSMPSQCNPTYYCVQVTVAEMVPVAFMKLFGFGSVQVTASSIATIPNAAESLPCLVCGLGTSGTGISVSGGSGITVTGGAIYTNSTDSNQAISVSGASSTLTSTGTGAAVGAVGGTVCPHTSCTPTPSRSLVFPDPYSALPAPSVSGSVTALTCASGACSFSPGVYSTLTVSSGATVTLTAGTYVFESNINIASNSSVTGTGVMFYVTCSGYTTSNTTACPGGTPNQNCNSTQFYIGSGGALTTTPPSTGTYQNMGIFFDRSNPNGFCGQAGAATNVGTIYAADSCVMFVGGAGSSDNIDASCIQLQGGANLTISASGTAPVDNGITSPTQIIA